MPRYASVVPESQPLASTSVPLSGLHDAVLLDLDGVVYLGPHVIDGAAEAIATVRKAGSAVAFVTNNASRTAATVAAHLNALGIESVDESDVVTAAQAVARLVANAVPPHSVVQLVGGEGLRIPLESWGLRCVHQHVPEVAAVVQGFAPEVGWNDLAEASFAIQAGVPWFVSNRDLTVPQPRGIAPGNGALVGAVVAATGATPVVAGKPETPLFDETVRRLGCERPLMVGDRPDTDIDGAIAAGMDSLLVLTGVASAQELADLPAGRRPTYFSPDLGGLNELHRPVTLADDAATCGAEVARVARGGIDLVTAGSDPLSALRATIALAWDRADRGSKVAIADGTLLR